MEATHPQAGRQIERLLWAVGEAHRRRRGDDGWAKGRGAPALGAPNCHMQVAVGGGHAHLSVVGALDGATAPAVLARVDALEQLERGVATRQIIGEAKGIPMQSRSCTRDEARATSRGSVQ